MRPLLTVIAEAERALATGEGDLAGLLRELVDWAGPHPNPSERERLAQLPSKPLSSSFLSLPVGLSVNPQMPGGIAPTPQGDMLFFNLQLVAPVGNFRGSRLLGANGQVPNPADGMLPILEARWVVPRERVARHVLVAVGLLHEETPS